MPPVSDDAVCIRHWDWSETSQTVSLFTRGHGLVRALAKGSKRPRSPYSGGVELLTRGQASFIVRPNSDLALLTAWDLEEMFPALRRSLVAHNAGLYMADLVQHAIMDHDPHPGLYDRMIASLRDLDDSAGRGGIGPALLRLQWALLVETGYTPVLDADAASAASSSAGGAYLFSAAHGGLVGEGAERGIGAWPVRPETIGLLRSLATDPAFEPAAAAPAVVERANRLLAAYIRHVLGREPPTLPVVFGPGLPV